MIDEKPNEESTESLETLKSQAEDYLNCWKRAMADYQNLKKETEKKQAEFAKFANLAIILELLPIFNNFQSAFACIPEEQKKSDWVKGIECIKKQLADLLKALGVEAIKAVGEKFDPELHEAIGREESEAEDGMIIKETQPGYIWHGKTILPAKVVVGLSKINNN